MDQQHLEEQLKKDYELLKELEDSERLADNPKQKRKFQIDIENLKKKINQRKAEIIAFQNQSFSEEDNSTRRKYFANKIDDNLNLEPVQAEENSPLSLTDLASFCSYSFPLLRWMYKPVPSQYVGWYFARVQEFFMAQGRYIPQEKERLHRAVEYFFRCAYHLPSFNYQVYLSEIKQYESNKLAISVREFVSIYDNLVVHKHLISRIDSLSIQVILIDLKDELIGLISRRSYLEKDSFSIVEKDILKFMIYVIDFLFDENKSRESGKRLDLPEGIVLKLQDILNHVFKARLGVQLPEREDNDVLLEFPHYVNRFSNLWKDSQGNKI